MSAGRPEPVLDGLVFPECPRWRDGRLLLSDMPTKQVLELAADGKVTTFAEVDLWPMGIGFLPDGSTLVVSMEDCRLLRYDGDTCSEYADLSGVSVGFLNDLVVDGLGRAYASNTGRDSARKGERRPANVVLHQEGSAPRAVASGFEISNGLVVTADGATLVVAETEGARLTAFSIAEDGSLTDRRVFAELDGEVPNGICGDAEGGVWVASHAGRFLRVLDGGRIVESIAAPGDGDRLAVACALGGDDGRQLFLTTAHHMPSYEEMVGEAVDRTGRVDVVTVDVPGAGWP